MEIRDGYDQTLTYEMDLYIESGAEGVLHALPNEGHAPLSVYLRLYVENIAGPLKYEWDVDADGTYELDTGNVGWTTQVFKLPGEHLVRAQVVGPDGNRGFYQTTVTVLPELLAPVAIGRYEWVGNTGEYAETAFRLYSEDSYDPDGELTLIEWDVDNDGEFDLQHSPATGSTIYKFDDLRSHTVVLRVTDNIGFSDKQTLYIAFPDPDKYQASIELVTSQTLARPETEITFSITSELSAQRELHKIQLDLGDGTVLDLGTDPEPSATHSYSEGTYRVIATMFYKDSSGAVYSKATRTGICVKNLEYDIAVIRNDGGVYGTNYDALVEDLGCLWNCTEYNWYSGIPADLSPADWGVVVWYRGGPGSDSEPQVYTTEWTDAEIDDYIQLMKDGHRVLLMSQSHGRNPDTDYDFEARGPDGWQAWYGNQYGWELLTGSIADDDIRHPWATSLGTDKAMCAFGEYGYLEAAPRNILATTSFGGKIASDGYDYWNKDPAERYNGSESSGDIPVTLLFPTGRQFVGIGYYYGFMKYHPYPNAGPYFTEGMNISPQFEEVYDLAYISYGNKAAPDENIGYLPNYSHTAGPGRLWVVGYPWAEVEVPASYNGSMTRPMLLMNILAWLRNNS
ncbi:hypothetical protein JW859_02365 [bacterium]|nr:hypothetical protein [bacterium]